MTLRSLPPRVGPWVSGEHFFNRDEERAQLTNDLEAGTHVLMTGQRRMGKTSIAREVGQQLSNRTEPWHFLFLDVDSCEDEAHMIAMLAEETAKLHRENRKIQSWAQTLLQSAERIEEIGFADFSVKIRESMTTASWQQHGDELLSSLATDTPCLLVIDEFPNLLMRIEKRSGKSAVDIVLRWLRRALQSGDTANLRVVVSGSIGLTPLIKRLGLTNAASLFDEMRVGPWSTATAIACLEARARHDNIEYEPGAAGWIVGKLGMAVPYHVQRVAQKTAQRLKKEKRSVVTEDDLDAVYQDMIQGGEQQLHHYRSRLEEALGDILAGHAATLLSHLADGHKLSTSDCKRGLGASTSNQDADWLLDVLSHDGYLTQTQDNWHFPPGIVRDWWRTQYPASSS